MAINHLDSLIIGDTDVIWLDSHKRAEFLVHFVHDFKPFAASTDRKQPEVGELGRKWCWYVSQLAVCYEIRIEIPRQ